MASSSTKTSGLGTFFDHPVRAETRRYKTTGERLRAEHGIATSQFGHLRYLHDHPDSRVAEIATVFAAGSAPSAKAPTAWWREVGSYADPNGADGRSSLLRLTLAGAELVADAEATFRPSLAELIGGNLADDQISTATATLATLRHALEREGIGTSAG